jgi:hypothetical protein
MPLIIPANSITGGYEVDNSLRFAIGSSDYLNRTPSSASNRKTFTWSFWVKRSDLASSRTLFSVDTASGSTGFSALYFLSTGELFTTVREVSGQKRLQTNQLFRDVSAWYHIVLAVDTTQGTASNRRKLYVNGSQVTSFSLQDDITQNFDTSVNNTVTQDIGVYKNSGGSRNSNFDGYMAEVVLIDGQQLDPTSFGEFDEDSGIWKPINVSGLTFGTNGFYLDFENSGSLGADVSGNGNNFTVNNLTSIDQSTDTCTNNFCTFNPLSADEMTFSQGNLKVVTASSPRTDDNARGTIGVNSGKWYWEIKTSGASTPAVIGICFDELKMGSDLSGLTGVYAIQNAGGTYAYKRENGSTAETTGFPNPVNDDIINLALDCDNAKLYIGINGTYYNQAGSTGNPATSSNETFSGIDMSHFWLPWLEARSTDAQGEANFGGTDSFTVSSGNADEDGFGNFEYAVPSGYFALCTKNLAEYG